MRCVKKTLFVSNMFQYIKYNYLTNRMRTSTLSQYDYHEKKPCCVENLQKKTSRVKTRFGCKKVITEWSFTVCGTIHIVKLYHSVISGKRVISIDGETVISRKQFFDDGGTYIFQTHGHNLRLSIVIALHNQKFE